MAKHKVFDLLVTTYLFLGGAGAGCLFIFAILALLSPASLAFAAKASCYRRFLTPGFAVSFALLALGVLCLTADLGRLDSIVYLFLNPEVTIMNVGAWALVITMALALALTFLWERVDRVRHPSRFLRNLALTLEIFSIAASIVVIAYTGLLLGSIMAVPLWNTAWLVALFIASALSCGFALMAAITVLTNSIAIFKTVVMRVLSLDSVFILLEAIFVACLIVSALGGGAAPGTSSGDAAIASGWMLLSGDLAPAFWGIFVVCGLLIPLVIEIPIVYSNVRAAFKRAAAAKALSYAAAANGACVAAVNGVYISAANGISDGVYAALVSSHSKAMPNQRASALLICSALVLIGGFALRFCIVEAGNIPLI